MRDIQLSAMSPDPQDLGLRVATPKLVHRERHLGTLHRRGGSILRHATACCSVSWSSEDHRECNNELRQALPRLILLRVLLAGTFIAQRQKHFTGEEDLDEGNVLLFFWQWRKRNALAVIVTCWLPARCSAS